MRSSLLLIAMAVSLSGHARDMAASNESRSANERSVPATQTPSRVPSTPASRRAPAAPATSPAPAPALSPMQMPQMLPPAMQSAKEPAKALHSSLSMVQLQVVPTLCESVPAAAWAVNDAENGVKLGGGDATPASQIWHFGTDVKNKCCAANVSYSVADQQAAGCSGTDSVSACMQKLTARCIRKLADDKNVRARTLKISVGAKELGTKLDDLAKKTDKLHGLLP